MHSGPEHGGSCVQTARADTAVAGLLLWPLQLALPRGLPAGLLTAEGRPVYGILPSGFRSDPPAGVSNGAVPRRSCCPTHTYRLLACCGTGDWVVPACCLTPLQANVTNMLELQATMSSRTGTFG